MFQEQMQIEYRTQSTHSLNQKSETKPYLSFVGFHFHLELVNVAVGQKLFLDAALDTIKPEHVRSSLFVVANCIIYKKRKEKRPYRFSRSALSRVFRLGRLFVLTESSTNTLAVFFAE